MFLADVKPESLSIAVIWESPRGMEQSDVQCYSSVGLVMVCWSRKQTGTDAEWNVWQGGAAKPILSPSQKQMLLAVWSRDSDRGAPPVETRSNGLESQEVGEKAGYIGDTALQAQPQILTAEILLSPQQVKTVFLKIFNINLMPIQNQ